MSTEMRPAPGVDAPRTMRWAWWSLVLYPVSLAAAFVVGEGVPAWFGFADATPPWWVMALALTAAAVVFASPLLVTVHFSRVAAAAHVPRARLPLLIAGAFVGGFVLINLISGILVLTTG